GSEMKLLLKCGRERGADVDGDDGEDAGPKSVKEGVGDGVMEGTSVPVVALPEEPLCRCTVEA
ncbi:hypothetical protein J6590_082551, partial [Homalodisca vitripennis]